MRILYLLFLLLIPAGLKAQYYSFYTSTSGNINISSIYVVTLTGGTAIPSFSDADDYASGVTYSNYLNVAIKSNVSWTLSAKAQSTYFTPQSSGGSTNMPASVLSMKASTSSSYFNMSTTSQTVKSGSRGTSSTSGNSFKIDIKYTPGFTYKGGIYTIGVLYTLSQQ